MSEQQDIVQNRACLRLEGPVVRVRCCHRKGQAAVPAVTGGPCGGGISISWIQEENGLPLVP
jgi:hypothetical protein